MTSSRISNQNSAKTCRKKIWSTAGRSIRSARRRCRWRDAAGRSAGRPAVENGAFRRTPQPASSRWNTELPGGKSRGGGLV